MMGSVSRPNRARATCPSAVIGQRTLWIGALQESHQDGHLHRPNRRTAFHLRGCMHDRGTARRSCLSRAHGRCAQPRAELRDTCPSQYWCQSNARPLRTSHSARFLPATEQVATHLRSYRSVVGSLAEVGTGTGEVRSDTVNAWYSQNRQSWYCFMTKRNASTR
jgi:hypothetical protein